MLTKSIFETLPITIIAASILIMVLMHSVVAVIVGGLCIVAACVMLYRRLSEMGTDPDVMDYSDTAKHKP
jgi:hypothetical protein